MSIMMHLYYTGTEGKARRFIEEMEMTGTADRIRKEEGNEKYEYFYPASDPETVLLIDIWKDQAALDRHHSSPMMKTIAELRDKYDLHMKAERFLVFSEDTSGSKFIRK